MKISLFVWGRESIMSAISHGLKKNGHEVQIIDLDNSKEFLVVIEAIDSFKPDFCFTHNFYAFDSWKYGEALEKVLKTKGIPVGTWYWDSPQISGYYKLIQRLNFGPNYPDQMLFFVVDKSHQDWFKVRNSPSTYLPIGVNDEFFSKPAHPHLKEQFQCDISFVGKPCSGVVAKVQNQDNLWRTYLEVTANDFYNLFIQTSAITQMMPEEVKVQLQLVGQIFYQFFNSAIFSAEECEERSAYCLEIAKQILLAPTLREYQIYSGRLEFFYSWFQLNYLLLSLQKFDLSVFGGPVWSENLLPHFTKKSPVLTNDELHACFAFSPISFCHTKWQFKTGVHERPLLVLAAGGFPLTDYRSGILDLFKPGEIAVYHSEEELLDLAKYYLRNESERLEISKRGRTRVLKDHSYTERSKVIVSEMKRHFNL